MSVALAPWQQRAFDQAVAALDSGRMGHALLFCGPAGLGKRAVAEALAGYVLCQAPVAPGQPCGRCRSCQLFAARSQRDPLETRPDGSPAQPAGSSSACRLAAFVTKPRSAGTGVPTSVRCRGGSCEHCATPAR